MMSNSIQSSPKQNTAVVDANKRKESRSENQAKRDEQQRLQEEKEAESRRSYVEKEVVKIQLEPIMARDYTLIPTKLDSKFEEIDEDGALCSTIIKPGKTWKKKYYKSLLSGPSEIGLSTADQKNERNKAYDLLDALTRSGALPIEYASLHIVVASTHCFGETLMNAVVKENINPIEKVEVSELIVASTIYNKPVQELLQPNHTERIRGISTKLFENSLLTK